jgi:peptidoglycan/xylan/chitin deacetylase (PgdA/CDA1 family)/glycosyltransferase involved in cell wall biosynthesis
MSARQPGLRTGTRGTRRGTASRPRIVSLLVVLAVMTGILLLNGYTHGEFAADHRVHPPVAADRVPAKVLHGGPVIDTTGSGTSSRRMPDRTVALTFDDGPDPTWTPKILDMLDRYGVKGTFFVAGAATAREPGLVRRMVASGDEVGVHTFTHPDLVYQSGSRTDRELAQTQLALAGAAGIHSSLVRPPYSAHAADLDDLSWPVVRQLGEKGYITALVDIDTEDWRRPGATAIADRVTDRLNGQGAVVLLHDSGGDRSQTVRALDTLIPELLGRGYRFTTVTGGLGAGSAHHPVSGAELWSGRVFVVAVAVGEWLVPALTTLMALVGGLMMLLRFAAMLVFAHRHARRRRDPGFSWGPEVTEPVSVVIPAYNERKCIGHTVQSVVKSEHPVEVVVVDDGSTDGTAETVEALALPGVTVVRQANRGKPAALNTGMARASYPLIVMMDGDTVFEPDTVHQLVQPFADRRVGAVAGNTKVGNRGSLLGTWQHLEYVMGLNLDRRMYDELGCIPTVPGAVGAFRRTALRHVGGLSDDTLAEDTDLTMALHRGGWHVVYEGRARAWTGAPMTVGQLWRQRYRWSYGTLQSMWKHRHAVVERGHAGHFGRYGLALVVLFTVLTPLLAPLIDLFLLYGLLFQDPVRTARRTTAVRRLRVAARLREAAGAVGAAAAAALLPPVPLHGAPPVVHHGAHRRPAALAQTAPHGPGERARAADTGSGADGRHHTARRHNGRPTGSGPQERPEPVSGLPARRGPGPRGDVPHLQLGLADPGVPGHGRHVRAGRLVDGPFARPSRPHPGGGGAGADGVLDRAGQ